MSIEICRCGKMIDTDEDGEAYEVIAPSGETINLSYALCPNCRDKFQGLMELKQGVGQFIQEIFDWVNVVGDYALLERLYEFRHKIDKLVDPKNAKGETT